MILGSFALCSVALWVGFSSILKPACAGMPKPTDTAERAPA